MVKKMIKRNSKERHWGISVLAVLGYIGSVFTLIAGLAMLFGASFISNYLSTVIPMIGSALIGAGLVLVGIFFVACAVLDYFIARGLWKGQNWARVILLVLMALSALGALMSMDIVSLAINAALIWYLGFYKPVVSYFK